MLGIRNGRQLQLDNTPQRVRVTAVRVFFSMHRLANLRLYESAIREMACRGHEIHMAFEEDTSSETGWRPTLNTLRVEYPTITCSWLSPPLATFWNGLAMTIRLWTDYLQYPCPDYDSEPTRRTRAADLVPPRLVRLTNRPVFQRPANRHRLLAVLRACEREAWRSGWTPLACRPAIPVFLQTLRYQRSTVSIC